MRKGVIVTGGCGFIGTNTSLHLANSGYRVWALDNFSRPSSKINAEELSVNGIEILDQDITDLNALRNSVKTVKPDAIVHLAGQVAVTTSIINPLDDFKINALGTINVLECAREFKTRRVIYSSTNKVYGELSNLTYRDEGDRYIIEGIFQDGISELATFNPSSPYGCSKGSADMLVRDYSKTYGLDTVTLRQSCVYGERQFGIEDQGWIVWFMILALNNRPITIFGDGKQVRDALYVGDLTSLYAKLIEKPRISNLAYNVGGGIDSSISVLELVKWLKVEFRENIEWSFDIPRLGDQKVFVSSNRLLFDSLGWKPETQLSDGLRKTWNWLESNLEKVNSAIGKK